MKKLGLLLCAAIALTCFASGPAAGTNLRGMGDFEFFVDISSLPFDSTRTLELLQIAVPTRDIEYRDKDGVFEAELRFHILVTNAEGESVFKKGYLLKDKKKQKPVSRDMSGFFHVTDSIVIDPGEYMLDIRIDDKKRGKRTLFGLLGKKYAHAELKDIPISVPDFSGDPFVLGEPVFIWSLDKEKKYAPNPMRIYGLKMDTMTVLLDALALESQADSVTFDIRIVDAKGETADSCLVKADLKRGRAQHIQLFDVNMYPAGGYRMNVTVSDGASKKSSGKDFSIAWELVNWQKPQREVLVEARILMRDHEFKEFEKSSIGEQERILKEFWRKLDPSPQTAVNETYAKFLARLVYADRNFGTSVRGALTDMGQIFIRLGPPIDIEEQVVPVNRDDIWRAISKLEDQYDILLHTVWDERKGTASQLRSPAYATHETQAFTGTVGEDAGSYQLWIYDHQGDPIFARDRLPTAYQGLRFLFIDLKGMGDFRLIGTSEEWAE